MLSWLLGASKSKRPWLHGAGAFALLLALTWLNWKTGAVFGFATAYLLPIIWAGLALPPEWSVLVGALASLAWLGAAMQFSLSQRVGREDWLTLPLIYPLLAILISHLARALRELGESLERERLASRSDPLTGLMNRRGFFEALDLLRKSEEKGTERTLLFLDLDHFKALNDHLGHEAGDSLLAELGALLRKAVPEALATRMGGDEFVCFFPPSKPAALRRRLSSLRQAVNAVCAKYSPKVTASLGAAHFRKAWPDPDMALAIGDAMMYRAKRKGKNRLVFQALNPHEWEAILSRPGAKLVESRRIAGREES